MRAGTTSVYDWLQQHDEIHTSVPKEPHWFAFPDVEPRYSGPGDQQLNDRIIWRSEDYRSLFREGRGCRYRAEASAMYLHLPEALDRLLDPAGAAGPDSRFVVLLRDPAQRSLSAYRYNRMRRREPCDLEEALACETDRRAGGWSPMFWYEQASIMSTGLARLLQAAPERTFVLLQADLGGDPRGAAGRLFSWLQLDTPEGLETGIRNRSGEPRSALVARALAHGPVKRRLKPLIPRSIRRRLEDLREHNLAAGATDEVAIAGLQDRLGPELDRLATLVGRPASEFS